MWGYIGDEFRDEGQGPRAGAGGELADARLQVAGFMGGSSTTLQGRYLAFIATYTTLHRRPPAEADIQAYFQVTPPSVHNMIVTLERRGLISKTPGAPRSIRVLVSPELLPPLE